MNTPAGTGPGTVSAVDFTLHLVIPDRAAERVLLVEDHSGWSLPSVPSNERTVVSDVGPTILDRLGLDVFVLRSTLDAAQDQFHGAVFLFTENLSDRIPTSGRWWNKDAIRSLDISDPRDRAAALAWLDQGRLNPRLQPWQSPGWFSAAVGWIKEALPQVNAVDQYATWCNSCVLRVHAGDKLVYFKASPSYFLREGEVTAMLGRLFQTAAPRVVALDPANGWMLLEDLGDELLSSMDLDAWGDALGVIGSVHRDSVPLVTELLAGGCLDRRPAVLSGQIEGLAEDAVGLLPDDLRGRLRRAVPQLQQMALELEASPIPNTLVHGDLHADNIAHTDRGFVLFDWTDACVASPFVDFVTFVDNFGPASRDVVVRNALRDRYLEAWKETVPPEQALEWSVRAEPIAAMHHAVSYRGIFDAFGPDEWWQFSSALGWWVEKALRPPLVSDAMPRAPS